MRLHSCSSRSYPGRPWKRKQTRESAEGIVPPRSRWEGLNRTGVTRPPTRSQQRRPRMGELLSWRGWLGSTERHRSTYWNKSYLGKTCYWHGNG